MKSLRAAAIRCLYLALGACLVLGMAPATADAKTGYYIEFRARMGTLVGHGFVLAGRTSPSGTRKQVHHLGFFAAGSKTQYLLSVVGVEGETGPLTLDRTSPTLEKFTVPLTSAQYRRLLASIRQWKSRPRIFNVASSNCNFFVARMARSVGLKAPHDYLRFPPDYVRSLRAMNRRHTTS